uniref:Si:ch211-10e2.1 n=1 Tax=Astyanax mexicanus TaxID=7994 RepID=W5LPA2_ASTMX
MDWFHCNNCFLRKGKKFAVTSCGHILCESCIHPRCTVCQATCNYLPISDKMKPQEKMFFMDPVNLIQTRLEHIAQFQIALFQKKQKERVIAFHKQKCAELERRLKEIREQCYQVSELKKENTELKKPLSQWRSGDTMERFRNSRPTPPETATPVSTLSSLHEHGFTPSSASTPLSDHITPNIFQFQLLSRPTLQSP